MKRSFAVSELKRYADVLQAIDFGRGNPCPVYRVAVANPHNYAMSPINEYSPYSHEVATLEFRAEPVEIRGCRCTAWYYGDVLVKVAV